MLPYLTDIDATVDNTFSCIINSEGGTSVIAYSLEINGTGMSHTYAKTTLSSALYNGDKLNISIPSSTSQMVNGNDYTWNLTLYESNPSMWVVSGVIQSTTASTTTTLYLRKHYNVKSGMYIKINGQTRLISSFSSTTGVATLSVALSSAPSSNVPYNIYSDNLTSSDYYFRARKTPVVSITNIPTTVASRAYSFEGSYTQIDNVAWKNFKFILYDSSDKIVEQSSNISTGLIKYTFDGLVDNTTYKIQLIVENQDGVISQTDKLSFNVDYLEPSFVTIPSTENVCAKNAVKVSWAQPFINSGVATSTTVSAPYYDLLPNVPYTGAGSVKIRDKCTLSYIPATSTETIDIPYKSTVYFYCKLNQAFQGTIIELTDEDNGDYYRVSYSNSYFNYDINGEITGSVFAVNVIEQWLLTSVASYNSNYHYRWEDTASWDDALYYYESSTTTLDTYWFKVTLLPDKILLTAIAQN